MDKTVENNAYSCIWLTWFRQSKPLCAMAQKDLLSQ